MKTRASTPITPEQTAYIIAHKNDRPRRKVAEDAGVSLTALYRIIRQHGGELRHDLANRNPNIEDVVRRCYPTMTTAEIARTYGYNKGRINKIAAELGIARNDEVQEIYRRKQAESLRNRTAESYTKGHKRWRLTRRMDEMRVMSGEPQRTNFRFAQTSHKTYQAKWQLVTKYGYIHTSNPYTLAYDSTTRRMNEDYYTQRYRIAFTELQCDHPLTPELQHP